MTPPSTALRHLVGAFPALTMMTVPFVDIPGRTRRIGLADVVAILIASLLLLHI